MNQTLIPEAEMGLQGLNPGPPIFDEGPRNTHPPGWKKHHRWQWGWQKWLAVVHLIERMWPRNG